MTGEWSEKTRENRLRRVLERRGYRLEKSRRRDDRALEYGRYRIVNPNNNTVVAGCIHCRFEMSLDDVEAWLKD